jgi:hypothetical protein
VGSVRLKPSRREITLLGLLAVLALVGLWMIRTPESAPVARMRPRKEAPPAAVPRIGLDRLDKPRGEVEVGRRDLFAYGARVAETAPPEATSGPPPPVVTTGLPPAADPAAAGRAPTLPPMNLRFIGAVGNARGVKVAVLLTDRNEVLTGQQGDVVANRYRIERIGIESVDLADVGTGQSRRIPLKGN